MIDKIHTIVFFMVMSFIPTSYAGGLAESLEKAGKQLRNPGEGLFVGFAEERQKQLDDLFKQRDVLQQEQKDFDAHTNLQLTDIKALISLVQKQLEQEAESSFLNKKLTILNETYQTIKDLQRSREQLVSIINDFIKLLQELLKDPDFTQYMKEHKLPERLYYSFEDVKKLYDMILEQEKRVDQLAEEEKASNAELESRKRAMNIALENYKKKKEELEGAQKYTKGVLDKESLFGYQEMQELLQLEDQLHWQTKELEALRIKTSTTKLHYIAVQVYIAKSHLAALKEYLRRIKPSIRVTDTDVAKAQEELSKKKQQQFGEKETLRQTIEQLTAQQKVKQEELETVSKKYGISLGKDLDEWSKEAKRSVDWYVGFCETSLLNTSLSLLHKKQQLADAQSALSDETLKYAVVQMRAKDTYHKITMRKFLTEEQISQEIKQYDNYKSEALAMLTIYKEKMNLVADFLNTQKKALDNIAIHRQELQKQKELIFQTRNHEYIRCIESLNQAEQLIKEQIDILGKMTGVYSGINSSTNGILRLIDFIVAELRSITIWHRPEYAISWQGVSNIIPNIGTFFLDIRTYLLRLDVNVVLSRFVAIFKHPLYAIWFAIKILAVLAVLILCRHWGNRLSDRLAIFASMQSGPLRVFALLAVMIFNFIDTYFAMLALWLLVFISLHLQVISDPYIYILFYLASIPYLLFLSRRFIRYCIQFNIRHDHIFLEADFQRRFAIVFSGLLYSTIIISFFREAFMLANYYRSELPTILLTVNFIIFQVSLILLISKEQILNLTPSRSDLWMSIRGIVNNYYYHIQLMIIAIIIMGNPYVGFGKLVLYILFGFIYTGFLIALLLWCHGLFKRVISRIFFVTDDEVIKERFANAKTWFGLLIITSFIVIGFIGVVMGAKIWGWPITVSDIVSLFDEPLLLKASAHPITVRSILQIIGFIFAGFILSYAISSFVLDKIFDLLLVDSGVQHTVTSITQYLVIIIAVFLGLQNVGLGELVGYFIAALTLSLGWVLREPISDFIAYFIILVQRPVKIGDYIKIDDHVMGVVRRITARAVILRKKNSNTIIVPNAMIISKPIMNWNYAHNFIAFNDIIIMIDYKEDAVKVKELLLAAVQSHPNILRSPQPIIRLESFSDYGYQFMIRGYISSVYTLEQWDIESDIRITIAKVLRDNSISVAIRPVGVTFLPTKEE